MKSTRSAILAVTAAICGMVVVWLLLAKNESCPAQNSILETAVEPAPISVTAAPIVPSLWDETKLDGEITDEELLQLARQLIAQDVARTLAWAQSQSDPTLRERVLFAVLQAWGELDPHAAITWTLAQDESQRFINMEAALTGATKQPEVALKIAHDLLAQNATTGDSYATMLVGALSRAGDFTSAMILLNDAPPDSRANWASPIFNLWGQTQPETAVKALGSLVDANTQATAFTALVDGWGNRNPATLADYAIKLPSGDDRVLALKTAIDRWTLQDPAAMTTWLNQFAGTPEFDFGAATMLMQTDGANRDTKTALAWAESIRDEELRYIALERVAREWAAQDPLAAGQYIEKTAWLSDRQRSELRQELNAPARAETVSD